MTFTPGVPFDGQSLDNSRTMVRGNFTSLYDTVNENHYPPNDANQGLHKKAVFIDDGSTTGTAANEVALFPDTYDAALQLMFRPPNQGGAADMWPACPRIRAYGAFNSTQAFIGPKLNCSLVKVGNSTYNITFTSQFPIGSASADYIVLAFLQDGSGANTGWKEFTVRNRAATGFTLETKTNSNVTYGCFLVIG